jgi:peptidoglycan/LPS O-acetylase OafA/YrhL
MSGPAVHSPPARAFIALDGVRGVAALGVLTRHTPAYFGESPLPSSFLAVDLFFLLSGFVLAHAYEAKLNAGLPAMDFMRLRYIRLYPLYFLSSAIGLALVLSGTQPVALDFKFGISIALNVVFLPGPFSIGPFPLNGPAWSLFLELAINVLFALTAPRLSVRRLALVVGAGLVAIIGCSVYFRSLDIGWTRATFVGGGARVLFSFFAGVLLYRAWKKFPPPSWLRPPIWLVPSALVALFALEFDGWAQVVFNLTMVAAIFPAMVYAVASNHPSKWARPVYGALGTASYAIYVFQAPVYLLAQRFWPDLSGPWGGAVFVTGLFLACLLIDAVYDTPMRAYLTRRLGRGVRKLAIART